MPMRCPTHSSSTLMQRRGPETSAPCVSLAPPLMVKFDEDPFEMSKRSSSFEGILSSRSAALHAFLGEALGEAVGSVTNSGGRIPLEWQRDQPLIIPGLRAGARFELGLQSVLEDELVLGRVIEIPDTPGIIDVVFEPQPSELVGLDMRVLDAGGAPIPNAVRWIKRPGARGYDSVSEAGWPYPDGKLTVRAEAPGYVSHKEDVDVRAVAPEFAIKLRRGREVSVRTLDEAGRALRPERVALLTSPFRSSRGALKDEVGEPRPIERRDRREGDAGPEPRRFVHAMARALERRVPAEVGFYARLAGAVS
jgi:hypothetical protein